jgi:drug/metabolite transporter (DMT)-like permease
MRARRSTIRARAIHPGVFLMNQTAQPASLPAQSARPAQRSESNRHARGILFCLAATVSFGGMFPVMTSALRHIDPFTFTSLRYLVAAAASLVLLRAQEGPSAWHWRGESLGRAWLLGSVGFAGFGFFVFLGQQQAGPDGALSASIMAGTQPMLAMLVGSIARRAWPPRWVLLFVLLSFGGVALVVTRGDVGALLRQPGNHAANGLILLGMVCWVAYTFGSAQFKSWSALKYATVTMCLGLATIVAINLALLAAGAVPVPSARDLLAIIPHLLYMSLIAGFVGVQCWIQGNKILAPLNGMLFMDVVPITAFTLSALTGVVPARLQIIGACVSGAALVLNNVYLRLRARQGA